MGKGQFSGEVGRASHEQDRSVRKSEGNKGQGFVGEERAEGWEIGELEEETCAARVCNDGGC